MIGVIVPFYDCGDWLYRCLDSLASQTYAPDRVVVIDDATPFERAPQQVGLTSRYPGWLFHRNEANLKCPHNLKLGTTLLGLGPTDVVLLLDGDDYLLPHCVEVVTGVYNDPEAWIAWGSYRRDGEWLNFMPNPARPFPPEVHATRGYRQHEPLFNHPLSFRRFLFDAVQDSDLQHDDGTWFQSSYDAAIMWPMLEMAGEEHSRFCSEVTYVYNEGNPLSDGTVRPEDNNRCHALLRSRPMKARLVIEGAE